MQRQTEHGLLAIVRDTPSSWERYEGLGELPSGLLLYLAGPTEEGVREIELWRSRAHASRHESARARRLSEHVAGPLRPPSVRWLVVERVLRPTNEKEDT